MPHHYTTSDVLRFQSKVKVMPSGCHEWHSARNRKGYGYFTVGGKQRYAHRVAWEMVNGPIPDGMLCCHTCDNPSCVNPEHIFIGTHKDNTLDATIKGRRAIPTGEKNPLSKLTEDGVREIRESISRGESQGSIAHRYGVSRSVVCEIGSRKAWDHVK